MRHFGRFMVRSFMLAIVLFTCSASLPELHAQGTLSLSTAPLAANTTTSANSFISFNMTASRPIRLYRFWDSFGSTGTTQVDIWAHPGGVVNANTGWILLGSTTVTVTSTTAYVEIPVTLNFLMQANQTWGFIISNTAISVKYSSAGSPLIFSNSDLNINLTSCCAGTGTGDIVTGITNFSFSLCTRQWCGQVTYDIAAQAPNDAGIASLDSPLNFCAGVLPIKATLQNFGVAQLTSAKINWQLNGVTQPQVSWTGLLDTLTIASRQTSVTLHPGYNFVNGVPYTFKVWTTLPNGQADTVAWNDTVTTTRQAAMAGTFTIGGVSPNFATFTDAVTALNNNGICGPVTFNVRTGTYTEQIQLNAIAGTSATNTITFQSETGVNTDVTLTYSANGTTYHTMMLNGTNWLRVKNMTIIGSNVTYGRVVTMQSGASNNIFDNNRIIALGTTSSYCSPLYQTSGGTQYNTFSNNFLQGGYYCIYWYSTAYQTQNRFINNKVMDFYYYGIYSYYQDSFTFTGNTVQTSVANTNYMFYGYYYSGPFNISNNKIISLNSGSYTKYGLMMYYAQAAVGNEGLISNNFISINGSTTAYGMYLYYPYNVNVEFNTVNNRQTTASGYTLYLYYGQNVRFQNNILFNNITGYLTYIYTTTWRGMDYNVYYTPYTYFGYWNGTTYANLAAWQAVTTMEARSLWKAPSFADITTGDLHLGAASRNDMTLAGVNEPYVTTDIDGDPRIIPYRGADEACYILPNTVTYSLTNASGTPVSYGRQGDIVYANVNVSFPAFDVNLTVTVNFYTVPGNQLVYTYTFNAVKQNGVPLTGMYAIPIPANLGSGYYRLDAVFNTRNSCGDYLDYRPGDRSLLVVSPGADPCIVWPGDVNNDGVVNYGDRTSLNKYIFNANLRPTWLQGPARYRADIATNPLTYYTWEGQASAPWSTPEGCYMDADGNGVVNTYDLIAIKMNWMKTHGLTIPKNDNGTNAASFDLSQNYPNPFNPSTTLEYALPERSVVRIVVTDVLGREVATLVNGTMEAGVHAASFDGSQLESGVYIATYSATGIESGLGTTKTIKMTLSK